MRKNGNNKKNITAKTSEGFLLVDKIEGPSSFAIVHQLRKVTGIQRIGHAGTLDPFASGLLILALGRTYTRQIQDLQNLHKVYELDIVLGQSTASLDPETPIDHEQTVPDLSHDQCVAACQSFIGHIQQVPPVYSAKHVQGQRSYKLARQGKEVKLDPVEVQIDDIQLTSIHWGDSPKKTSL